MQDTACDDGVERPGVVELLERDLAVERPGRRVRVDREHVVARRRELRARRRPRGRSRPRARVCGGGAVAAKVRTRVKSTTVSLAQARRIAVRAQLLDGSATSVLDTVRRARLPADRPDLDGRAAAAPRALEPARSLRHRPSSTGCCGRSGSSSSGPRSSGRSRTPADPRADAAPAREVAVGAPGQRVPRDERRASGVTCCRSSSSEGRCSPARSRPI